MALNSRYCAEVPLRNCSLTQSLVVLMVMILVVVVVTEWVSEWVRVFKRRTKTESHYAPQCHLNKNAFSSSSTAAFTNSSYRCCVCN